MNRHPFWMQDCPARSVLLTHMHDSRCTDHLYDQCCYCGQRPGEMNFMVERVYEPVEPPLDIAHRLREMGLINDEGQPVVDDAGIIEVTERNLANQRETWKSAGVIGPPWGPGRSWRGDGALNPRDYPKMEFIKRRCEGGKNDGDER